MKKYFSNYLILFDGDVYKIEDFLPISGYTEDDFFNIFISKEQSFVELKPTREEIRNAMMKECENYYLLEPICKVAVEIAYLLG